jgi:hypothetical protein
MKRFLIPTLLLIYSVAGAFTYDGQTLSTWNGRTIATLNGVGVTAPALNYDVTTFAAGSLNGWSLSVYQPSFIAPNAASTIATSTTSYDTGTGDTYSVKCHCAEAGDDGFGYWAYDGPYFEKSITRRSGTFSFRYKIPAGRAYDVWYSGGNAQLTADGTWHTLSVTMTDTTTDPFYVTLVYSGAYNLYAHGDSFDIYVDTISVPVP